MTDVLTITVARAEQIAIEQRAEIIALCAEAYEEDFDHLFDLLPGSAHVLGRADVQLVSHAAWVTRWLQPEGHGLLRTAYVEAVATRPEHQGRGFATAVLRALGEQIDDYELGALSPSDAAFYTRLGWELWHGPLAIRTDTGLVSTPDEEVMILRLARTPALDTTSRLTAEWRVGELW